MNKIKADRTMEEKFMLLEEMLRHERKEGIEEGLQQGVRLILKNNGIESPEIEEMLLKLTDVNKLELLFSYVLTSKSTEEIKNYLHSLIE